MPRGRPRCLQRGAFLRISLFFGVFLRFPAFFCVFLRFFRIFGILLIIFMRFHVFFFPDPSVSGIVF